MAAKRKKSRSAKRKRERARADKSPPAPPAPSAGAVEAPEPQNLAGGDSDSGGRKRRPKGKKPEQVAAATPEPTVPEASAPAGERAPEAAGGLDVFDLDADDDALTLEAAANAAALIAHAAGSGPAADVGAEDAQAAALASSTAPAAPTVPPATPDAVAVPPTPLVAAPKRRRPLGVTTGAETDAAVLGLDGLDLGTASTPEARARILAAALAHADMQEARYRVPITGRQAQRWKAYAALTLFGLAGWFLVVPPAVIVPDAPARPSEAARAHGLRVTLLLQAQQVEAFRAREQRLPDSLDDLVARADGVRFVRSGQGVYQLIGYTARGEAIVYDSAEPTEEFRAVAPAWIAGGPS